ncbi:MAG: signal peptidase II [Planctomycetes bacterium]|nr:signal peptidase II [Planctomycetota bacterium]
MTEFKTEEGARPSSGRAFLSDTGKPFRCFRFFRGITLPPLKAHLIFWLLTTHGLALDLWSKKAVFDLLEHQPNNSYSIIDGVLTLVRALNDGAAFGIFSGRPYMLVAVSVVALIAIFGIFLYSGSERRLVHVALGFFAAGVCGNLYDRLFNNGMVRDFIDVVYWPGKHWPAFNVADSLLCLGVGLMVISCLLTDKSPPGRAQQHK